MPSAFFQIIQIQTEQLTRFLVSGKTRDKGSPLNFFWFFSPNPHYVRNDMGPRLGCFRKCHFGIPRNTEFYTELVLFRVIPRNFLLFNSAEFVFVYTEFRIPSNENAIIELIRKDLWKLLMYFVVKGAVARDLPPPFFFIKSTHLGAWFIS
jgi:hypothetical protein